MIPPLPAEWGLGLPSGRPVISAGGQNRSGCRSGGAPPGARWRQWPGDGRAGSDALAPWHPRQLCGHERGSDVHQPARRYLQASHDARLLAGPPGNCRQNWPSNCAGGGDDRLRLGAHTSGRDLPHLLDQTGCRACAMGRKDPSRRCRIIYLTSELSIRYGHHDQDQRRRSNGRCRTRWQSPVGPELSELFQVLVNLQSKACSNIKLRRQVTERSRLLVTP